MQLHSTIRCTVNLYTPPIDTTHNIPIHKCFPKVLWKQPRAKSHVLIRREKHQNLGGNTNAVTPCPHLSRMRKQIHDVTRNNRRSSNRGDILSLKQAPHISPLAYFLLEDAHSDAWDPTQDCQSHSICALESLSTLSTRQETALYQ